MSHGVGDLHTHLLGMGNDGFWVEKLMQEYLGPERAERKKRLNLLFWHEGGKYLAGKEVDKMLSELDKQYSKAGSCQVEDNKRTVGKDMYKILSKHLGRNDVDEQRNQFQKVLRQLPLNQDAAHGKCKEGQSATPEKNPASFSEQLTHEVIFARKKLVEGFGISSHLPDSVQQLKLEGILYELAPECSESHGTEFLKDYLIWNARKQRFDVVNGITLSKLLDLAGLQKQKDDANDEKKADSSPLQKALASFIRNCFSMKSNNATEPLMEDLVTFRGQFTPEFYPRRFALKDCLYEQRLDVLVVLLCHLLERYSSYSFHEEKVKAVYIEFSVGVNDIVSLPVFHTLIAISDPDNSKYHEFLKGEFPDDDLSVRMRKATNLRIAYKFLAGFARHGRLPPSMQNISSRKEIHAGQLALSKNVHSCVAEFLQEIQISKEKKRTRMFAKDEALLSRMISAHNLTSVDVTTALFFKHVVGLDLFSDELGWPYVCFVTHEFIKFALYARDWNSKFGLRIHAGENAPYTANYQSRGLSAFAAHMFILSKAIEYIRSTILTSEEGTSEERSLAPVRIGHGTHFTKVFDLETKSHPLSVRMRNCYAFLCEVNQFCENTLKHIPVEVNLTSNHYLLHMRDQAKKKPDIHPFQCMQRKGVPCVLGTDDDGIWDITQCRKCSTPTHIGLAAEYCDANELLVKIAMSCETVMANSLKFAFSEVHMDKQQSSKQEVNMGENAVDEKQSSKGTVKHFVQTPDEYKSVICKSTQSPKKYVEAIISLAKHPPAYGQLNSPSPFLYVVYKKQKKRHISVFFSYQVDAGLYENITSDKLCVHFQDEACNLLKSIVDKETDQGRKKISEVNLYAYLPPLLDHSEIVHGVPLGLYRKLKPGIKVFKGRGQEQPVVNFYMYAATRQNRTPVRKLETLQGMTMHINTNHLRDAHGSGIKANLYKPYLIASHHAPCVSDVIAFISLDHSAHDLDPRVPASLVRPDTIKIESVSSQLPFPADRIQHVYLPAVYIGTLTGISDAEVKKQLENVQTRVSEKIPKEWRQDAKPLLEIKSEKGGLLGVQCHPGTPALIKIEAPDYVPFLDLVQDERVHWIDIPALAASIYKGFTRCPVIPTAFAVFDVEAGEVKEPFLFDSVTLSANPFKLVLVCEAEFFKFETDALQRKTPWSNKDKIDLLSGHLSHTIVQAWADAQEGQEEMILRKLLLLGFFFCLDKVWPEMLRGAASKLTASIPDLLKESKRFHNDDATVAAVDIITATREQRLLFASSDYVHWQVAIGLLVSIINDEKADKAEQQQRQKKQGKEMRQQMRSKSNLKSNRKHR